MRLRTLKIAALITLLAASLAAAFAPRDPYPVVADDRANAETVDVELVLAVDISYSMDPEEQALQREGYIRALTSKEFLQALRNGLNGKIAVTYFEWAGANDQRIVVPWRVIDGPESADLFAADIQRAPYRRASRTSISGALQFGKSLFEANGYRGLRRVIDVSGDGVNNSGAVVTMVRDELIADGIVINGLPIVLNRPYRNAMDVDNLDTYYEDCVIGGHGAFVVPIREREQFVAATRTKLVQEIASREREPRLLPASADRPRMSCTIGERIWQERWGN